ncbi:calcium/sodium antiporter [Wenxinia marina]|uniref:K+-dependent Na+/Ca+ exchanger related-protein n=1 Tax=Wenxinia marina DSM 24838 TaxID=1123501 RepID=A0A0D0NPX9_9RHOB|nr:calcium/sodium antiporter [Wenxinia marina]KIQ70320.1 K+-dependent Na+/Ca+ exchanger related-protein [Wenxinia marina DSM 24838]GGL54045.1 sodium:calcium antiporter [Wenxinia marina]
MAWLSVVAGLAILVVAGDTLVKGAVNLALRLGIPALVVGLTVVAFGTSAPELLVSVQAVLADQPGIALGNVVGSNIANVLLVLGLPALIQTLHAGQGDTRRSYIIMMLGSVLFAALLFTGTLTIWHGLVLLAGLAVMLWDSYRSARAHRKGRAAEAEAAEVEGADPGMPGWRIAAFLVVGLAGLPFGANLLVGGATEIARTFGLSEAVIGLTLVAIGTSLPELAATTVAAVRRQADVAIGNVIGSNVFNLLAIIGISALVRPIAVPREMLVVDIWVMLGASVLLAPFVLWGRDIGRGVGIAFCTLYVAYVAALVAFS